MKSKILLIATGGTIAGVQPESAAKANDDSNYTSGVLSGEELIRGLHNFVSSLSKELNADVLDAVDITCMQLCNKNSDDIDQTDWLRLSAAITDNKDSYDAIIITHGTDTLEETGFFLEKTVSCRIPIIITCAMYPATSPNADGPKNLYDSIALAYKYSKGEIAPNFLSNIMLVFNGKVLPAGSITKEYLPAFRYAPYTVDGSAATGTPSECVNTGEFTFNAVDITSEWFESSPSHFDISLLHAPYEPVPIAYFSANADAGVLYFYVNQLHAKAVVIAGAGAGEFSLSWLSAISELCKQGVKFIRTSKINKAPVNTNERLSANTIDAGNMSPEKASILASLLLAFDLL